MTLRQFIEIFTVNDGSGGRKIKATTTGGVDDVNQIFSISDALGGRKIKIELEGGGGGIQSVVGGTDITIDNTDPENPIVNYTGTPAAAITVVANYSALPAPATVPDEFYWAEASQGTAWLPGSLGGTYYGAGMYYSNGVAWTYTQSPYQATQATVNTGTNTDQFVSPATLTDADVVKDKQLLTGKDATGGYVGLTLFKINFKNVANTFTSFFTNSNTAARTYTFQDSSDTIVGRATTDTLTNKRNQPRVVTVNAPGAIPTINTDNGDIFSFTGLAANITSMTTNLSGTPVECEKIEIIFVGTLAYTIAWGTSFVNSGFLALPTTTAAGVKLRVGFEREGSTWVIISIA